MSNGTINIYCNAGGGTFNSSRTYGIGGAAGSSEPYLFATDFDGDTWPDIVVGTGHPDFFTHPLCGSSIRVLINRGNGRAPSMALQCFA